MFYITCLLTYLHIKIFVHIKQKYLTCIPCENKPFWQLSQLNYFSIKTIANIFVQERLKIPEAYSEPRGTVKIELFAKMVNN